MALVDDQSVFAAVADQRRQFVDLIDSLDATQLATPSLCQGWDVKTVAAHVVSTIADGMPGFFRAAIRGGSLSRGIDRLARHRAQAPTSDIVADLRANADRPVSPPLFGPRGPLADILVHTGDVRIALGLPFEPDLKYAVSALDFLTGGWRIGFAPLGRLRGIRLVANDIDRSWGAGIEVGGPTAALMMSVCGRTAALDALDGPGCAVLRRRIR